MPQHSDDKLKEASGHLFYEYEMMRETARALDALQGRPRTDEERIGRNAIVESFVVHVRNLVVFLGWHKSNHDEDVLARHYAKFTPKVPDGPWLSELYEAASTRVVHLSYRRTLVDPRNRDWPVREIVEAVSTELERLIKMVPPHVLDARWSRQRSAVFSPHAENRASVPTMMATDSTTLSTFVNRLK